MPVLKLLSSTVARAITSRERGAGRAPTDQPTRASRSWRSPVCRGIARMNTRNLPRLAAAGVAAFAAGLMCPSVGYAQLPDPLPASVIAFDSGGKTHYDFTSRLLS